MDKLFRRIRSTRNAGLPLLLLVLMASNVASATPLVAVWPANYRGDIKVYLCTTTFTNFLSTVDQGLLESNVRLAIENWNTYSGVDFRMRYMGARTGTSNGCAASQFPAAGEITVKAELAHPGSRIAGCSYDLPNAKATISLYAQSASGTPRDFTFDNRDGGITVLTVLMHEFGHAIGFPDVSNPPYATVMEGSMGGWQRVLWDEDVLQLRNPSSTYHYNQVQNRQIVHKRSVDAALTWTAEGNLSATTNHSIGVTYNASAPSGRQYLVAWTGTNGGTNLNTIMGDGSIYDNATKVIHSQASNLGPSATFGNGTYLMVHVHTDDLRTVEYQTSTNGINWTGATTLLYQGGTNYGSMWEPDAAYNANKNKFIVAWTNWQDVLDDNPLSRVRICTNSNPAGANFSNCIQSTFLSATAPGLTCHATNNECMVTWTDHTGAGGHQICAQKGNINTSGAFAFTGAASCLADNTKLATNVAFGGSRYVRGWTGTDAATTGNSSRQSAWPTWTDKRFPDTLLQAAPTLVYGSAFGEFAYYYTRR